MWAAVPLRAPSRTPARAAAGPVPVAVRLRLLKRLLGERLHPGLLIRPNALPDGSLAAVASRLAAVFRRESASRCQARSCLSAASTAGDVSMSVGVGEEPGTLKERRRFAKDTHFIDYNFLQGLSSAQEEAALKEYGVLQVNCSMGPLAHCAGTYEIVTGYANGRPAWRRDCGAYWLYAGTDGKWYMADRQVFECGFFCAYVFARGIDAHEFSLPSDATQWAWWDGNLWETDGTITIHAAPQAQDARHSRDCSKQVIAEGCVVAVPSAPEALPSGDCNGNEDADDSVPGVPSEGSTNHEFGTCKPCAWYWTPKSCDNNALCRFCHLCPKGEIQRRRAARRQRIAESKHAKNMELQRLRTEASTRSPT